MDVHLCCIISFDYISETLIVNRTVCRPKQIIVVIDETEMKKIIASKSFITCKRKFFENLKICLFTFAYFAFVQNY